MSGIQAVRRESGLTVTYVRTDDCYGVEDGGIRGMIKTPGGEIAIVHSGDGGKIKNRFPCARRDEDITAITFSGDRFGGGGAAGVLARFHSCGVCEKLVSVSEIGMTVYLGERDGERAWECAKMMIKESESLL